MKSLRNIGRGLVAILFAFVVVVNTQQEAKAQNQYVDFDVFYNELSPYGNWYNDQEYGYVWQPNNINNFQPYYTNGYWVMTEYGNTWVSNYSWGWAPFHYGRWMMSGIGWVWIPGNQWGPAWVDWRQGNGYYGWAPMGPQINMNINIGRWNTPANWFVFVQQGNIYNRGFHTWHRPNNYMNIYNNTIIVNNYYNDRNNRPMYNSGPARHDIRRHTNRDVPVYNITNAQTRSAVSGPRGNNITVYRPEVRNNNRNAAPRNVRTMEATNNNRAAASRNNNSRATQNTPQVQPTRNSGARQANTTEERRTQNQNTNRATQTQPAARQQQATPARSTTPARNVQSTPARQQQAAPSRSATPARNVQSTPARQRQAASASRSTTPSRSVQSTPSRQQQAAPARSAAPRQAAPASREVQSGARR